MGAEADGIAGIVAGAIDQARDLLASERARQLDLLAVPDAADVVAAREELGVFADREVVLQSARRRGRPPGAVNKRTGDFAKWLLGFGPHPAVTMMRIQGMRTEDLAKIINAKPIEALDRQIRCATELLPYLEGKQPIAIDINAKLEGLGTLVIAGVTHSEAEVAEILAGEFVEVPDEAAETADFRGLEPGE